MSDMNRPVQSLTEAENEEQVIRLRAMSETCSTMGWRWFIAEVEREREVIKEQLTVADLDSVLFLQGRLDQLNQTINFEDLVDNYLDSLETLDE